MLHIRPLLNRPVYLKDREKGRRAFILGNGPSVKQEKLTMLRREVVIGMNASTMLEETFGFNSGYYVLSDARFLCNHEKRQWGTSKLSAETIRVVRSELREFDDPELEMNTYYVRAISRDGFSTNLHAGFFYGCTTTMLAIQLAYYLGCNHIYLLGCDLHYPTESPRFYYENTPQIEDAFTSVQIMNIVNSAIEIEKKGRMLVNCSPRSFLRPYLQYSEFASLFV